MKLYILSGIQIIERRKIGHHHRTGEKEREKQSRKDEERQQRGLLDIRNED
mgnify:CR=1 FL=1